ncbi:MAG: UDP-N-acetylmuramate dehydrogenase [Lachnospiraceae bacterium]|nr:UDP-N-acetylmuramate dehydrogenase [Lachnospiraceae bacterium]
MGLFEEIRKLNIEVSQGEPMSRHTSFRIGGPADLFARPKSAAEMAALIKLATEWKTPYFVIGRGSNLLVGDGGIKKLVIATEGMNYVRVEGESVTCGAGASLTCVAAAARDSALSGLEFAYGIPGSVGGAVVMNAGAYGGEIVDVLSQATVLDANGALHKLNSQELELKYRHSNIEERGYIVLEAVFALKRGSVGDITEVMEKNMQARKDKQPLDYPNAGSAFKRPEGYFAGKLIMDAGLKGFSVGDACVSEKHAGFVINKGSATASDVRGLLEKVADTVYDRYGIRLEPEIKFEGEF